MDVTAGILMAVLATLAVLTNNAICQKLPESSDDNGFLFNIPPEEVFYDTKVLPDGKEVAVFLPRNETKRFFFVVEHGRKPVYFAVSPCSSIINWRLYFRYQSVEPDTHDEDDPLVQQRAIVHRPRRSKRLLQSIQGNDLMTYVSRQFRTGLFILELSARDRHATVRVYATASPDAELAYPDLPPSSTIDVLQRNSEGVTVAWQPSPSEATWQQPIEYCIAYNTRKNYRTLCALKAERGTESPPMIPSNAGFGFSWERNRIKESKKFSKASMLGKTVMGDGKLECVGRRTWHTLSSLLPGIQYFVDVFALIPSNNRSVAYRGASFIAEGKGRPLALQDGRILYVSLRHLQASTAMFEFKVGKISEGTAPSITVLPCFGQMNVKVLQGVKTVFSSTIRQLHKFVLPMNSSTSEPFIVQITGDSKQTQSLKISAARRIKRDPFPELPTYPRLHSHDRLTSCSSVTLSWPAPDEKAVYCLYRRREPGTSSYSFPRSLFSKQDMCNSQDVPRRNEKIFCRRYRRSSRQRSHRHSPHRDTVRETVGALQVGATYVFELQVTRRRGETLTYESVQVSTRDKC